MTPVQLAMWEHLEVRPTVAMQAGTQRVDQCAWCGTIVVSPSKRKPTGSCPSCDHDDGWWAATLPIAGIHRKGDT